MVPAHSFHFMVPLVHIGEQKKQRFFCEAVNWSHSDQEGKFLFFAMLHFMVSVDGAS